ncbi:MAG: hypothetical protein Q8M51_06470 [Polaromonas sp.]|nr:hypothetical protein [Polaromonas sp.]
MTPQTFIANWVAGGPADTANLQAETIKKTGVDPRCNFRSYRHPAHTQRAQAATK